MANEGFDLSISDNEKGKDTFQDYFKTDIGGSTVFSEKESSRNADFSPVDLLDNTQTFNKLTDEWANAFADLANKLDIDLSRDSDDGLKSSSDITFEKNEDGLVANNLPSEDNEKFADGGDQDGHDDTDSPSDMVHDDFEETINPVLTGQQAGSISFFDIANETPLTEKVPHSDINLPDEEQEDVEAERAVFKADILTVTNGLFGLQEVCTAQNTDISDFDLEQPEQSDYSNTDWMIGNEQIQVDIPIKEILQALEDPLTTTTTKEVFEKVDLGAFVSLHPLTKNITVHFSKEGKKTLVLVDPDGKTIEQWVVEGVQFKLSTANMQSGIYFLNVQTKGNRVTVLKLDISQ